MRKIFLAEERNEKVSRPSSSLKSYGEADEKSLHKKNLLFFAGKQKAKGIYPRNGSKEINKTSSQKHYCMW